MNPILPPVPLSNRVAELWKKDPSGLLYVPTTSVPVQNLEHAQPAQQQALPSRQQLRRQQKQFAKRINKMLPRGFQRKSPTPQPISAAAMVSKSGKALIPVKVVDDAQSSNAA